MVNNVVKERPVVRFKTPRPSSNTTDCADMAITLLEEMSEYWDLWDEHRSR